METRPNIKIEPDFTDLIFEIAGWVMLIILWGLVIYGYTYLPDVIPSHFDATGKPDQYGSKSILLLLPVMGTFMFILLTILIKYPHSFNYPVKITAENALRQYTNATKLLRYMKFIVVSTFSIIVYEIYLTSTGKLEGLGIWFLPVILLFVFVPLIFFIINSLRK